jgi:hypothetical protein
MILMLRSLSILAASSWLALFAEPAAADPPPSRADLPSAPADAPPTTANAPSASEPPGPAKVEAVKEVTLDPTAKPPVCRRYVPTGSRIATERCQSAETADDARAAERDQTRRDIDEMRMRQATRNQARAATQAEALRQRAGF